MATTTTRNPTEVQQAAYNKGTIKSTGEVYYTVHSDTDESAWYTLRWDTAKNEWGCNCPSQKPCKHQRGLNEVLRAQAEERRAKAPLNGTRGFSLLRK